MYMSYTRKVISSIQNSLIHTGGGKDQVENVFLSNLIYQTNKRLQTTYSKTFKSYYNIFFGYIGDCNKTCQKNFNFKYYANESTKQISKHKFLEEYTSAFVIKYLKSTLDMENLIKSPNVLVCCANPHYLDAYIYICLHIYENMSRTITVDNIMKKTQSYELTKKLHTHYFDTNDKWLSALK